MRPAPTPSRVPSAATLATLAAHAEQLAPTVTRWRVSALPGGLVTLAALTPAGTWAPLVQAQPPLVVQGWLLGFITAASAHVALA